MERFFLQHGSLMPAVQALEDRREHQQQILPSRGSIEQPETFPKGFIFPAKQGQAVTAEPEN